MRYTLSLPKPLDMRVREMAESLGLPVATFIRHLLIEEVRNASQVPVFPMSKRTEKVVEEAENNWKNKKLEEFSSIDEMFAKLDNGDQ
jgi:hypothetical protein